MHEARREVEDFGAAAKGPRVLKRRAHAARAAVELRDYLAVMLEGRRRRRRAEALLRKRQGSGERDEHRAQKESGTGTHWGFLLTSNLKIAPAESEGRRRTRARLAHLRAVHM